MKREPKAMNCSFCGKSADEVKTLVSGPSVYICDECVKKFSEILAKEDENTDGRKTR
jgi:ATP-dependent Clp protease ATP-binding subunit ClpX